MGHGETQKLCISRWHCFDQIIGHKSGLRPRWILRSFTKNGMYSVKSRYWVATNLLRIDTSETSEPSITKLQAFALKLKAPPKIRHFIWQAISGQLAVTSNLTHRHMRCDNHCPRCGAKDETINHALFECPPALQTCANATTPTPSLLFPSDSHFTNMD